MEVRQALMMGERLELDARRGARWMRIVGDQIASPDLQWIHADLRGSKLNQGFGDRRRDRMPHCAILAHDVLVLEHDPRAGAVVRAGVGEPTRLTIWFASMPEVRG